MESIFIGVGALISGFSLGYLIAWLTYKDYTNSSDLQRVEDRKFCEKCLKVQYKTTNYCDDCGSKLVDAGVYVKKTMTESTA